MGSEPSYDVRDPRVRVVSDIDFSVCIPAVQVAPLIPPCLAPDSQGCVLVADGYSFPGGGLCVADVTRFPKVMDCGYRDAFSESFYEWMASLTFEDDRPIDTTVSFLAQSPHPITILSNRNRQCEAGTRRFLTRLPVGVGDVILREVGDYRPLWAFKVEQIHRLAKQFAAIIWLDDQCPPVIPPGVQWIHPATLTMPNQDG